MTLTLLSSNGTLDHLILSEDDEYILADEGEACCCSLELCCCTRISNTFPPENLMLRFITGCATMTSVEITLEPVAVPAGVCRKWRGQTTITGPSCIVLVDAFFECSVDPDTPSGCFDYSLTLTYHNSECAPDQSQTAVFPEAGCQCGITGLGSDKFLARYNGFTLVNGIGPNCDCCAAFDCEVYEP
jgi:hypothetical protein